MSTSPDRTYIWMTPDMPNPVEEARVFVDLSSLPEPHDTEKPA
jgi:hypothetical protein